MAGDTLAAGCLHLACEMEDRCLHTLSQRHLLEKHIANLLRHHVAEDGTARDLQGSGERGNDRAQMRGRLPVTPLPPGAG